MSSAVSMSFSLPPAPPPTTTSVSAPTPANSSNSANSANSGSPQATYKVPKFLRSLYSILQNEDASVVTWLQNQELKPNRVTAFHILDLDRFEHHVLPKYFKHSKFASFQRQLNNFGFRKWTKTQSSGVCTFSHNCFPPDPREIGVLRASIREQWRQKNTDTRRRVGNGITKAERKLQQQVQQQVQQLQLPVTKPSTSNTADSKKLLDSPSPSPAPSSNSNSNNSMASPTRVESFSEMLKTPLAPTHQPQVKKLARGDWTSSSNSSTSDAFKPSTLPHVSFNNTVNIGSSVAPPPPVVYHCPPPPPMLMIPNAEPWAWHPSMAYEVQPFQYAAHVDHHSHHQQQHHAWAGALRKPFAEQQVSPSTMEEFTFDSLLLFAE